MVYTVKTVAEMAGISVRALHHYDEIGLLRPAEVSDAGYRLYAEPDLERLQQILFFRELGFSLQEIKRILDHPDFDRRQALISQRALLVEKRQRLEDLIGTIDETVAAMEGGSTLSKEAMFGAFDEAEMEAYRAEADALWGHSNEYQESSRRTSRYSKQEWQQIFQEGEAIILDLAALMEREPADPDVQACIDRWFCHINERFFTCRPEIFRAIGEGYVADERFTAFYDKVRPGLARFKRDAMRVYCDLR